MKTFFSRVRRWTLTEATNFGEGSFCRDIALRYTARALALVILITSLISANQMLGMIILIS